MAQEFRREYYEIPWTAINRIIRQVIPEDVQIRKDTKLALMNAAKTFILYVTSCSNDFCHSCSRTIIGATHVLGAIDELEFEGMTPKLKELLADFKKEQQSKKSGRKKSDGKLKKSDKEGQTLEDTQTDQNEVDMGEEGVEQAEDEDLDLISLF